MLECNEKTELVNSLILAEESSILPQTLAFSRTFFCKVYLIGSLSEICSEFNILLFVF